MSKGAGAFGDGGAGSGIDRGTVRCFIANNVLYISLSVLGGWAAVEGGCPQQKLTREGEWWRRLGGGLPPADEF
jgi:hypothetical protein